MNVQQQIRTASAEGTGHFDVVIAGAGISGVGVAYHLTKQCAGTSFVILETQKSFGGTWLTHRYPGIRSDSDLFTFGYRFKPWIGAPIHPVRFRKRALDAIGAPPLGGKKSDAEGAQLGVWSLEQVVVAGTIRWRWSIGAMDAPPM